MHVIKRGEEGPPPRGGTDRPARGFHRHRGAGGRWGGRSSLGGGGVGGLLSWHRVWGNGVNPAALGGCVCVRLMAPGAGGRDPPCFGGSLSWHLK